MKALLSVLAKTLGKQALCRVFWPKHSANLGAECHHFDLLSSAITSTVWCAFSLGGVTTSSSYEVLWSDDKPPSSILTGLELRHSSVGLAAIGSYEQQNIRKVQKSTRKL